MTKGLITDFCFLSHCRKRKVTDNNNSKSPEPDNPIIIDDGTRESDYGIFIEDEVFIVEPHCSIEIGDLESCDTCIKRWKMVSTCCI